MIFLYFRYGGQRYRMRVAKVHVHPGERDKIEQQITDMTGGTGWIPVPDGSTKIPHPDWIVRRALWSTQKDDLTEIDLEEVGR